MGNEVSNQVIDLISSRCSEFDPGTIYFNGDLVRYQGKLCVVRKTTPSATTRIDQLIEIVPPPRSIKVPSSWDEAIPFKEGDLISFGETLYRIGKCYSSTKAVGK